MKINLRLLEGRKQILSILSKVPNAEMWTDFIISFDPSRTKKYADVVAKEFKNDYVGGIQKGWNSDELLDHLKKTFEYNYKSKLLDLIPKAEAKNANIDINKFNEVEDLITALEKEAKRITRSSFKKGFEGLTDGEDYSIMYENENIVAVMPFSWKASRVLASSSVGHCEGEWCIAYQKTSSYWDDIVVDQGQAPVFFINLNRNDDDDDYWGKYAFMYHEDELDIWNQYDRQEGNNNHIFGVVGITKEINNSIWSKARTLAEEKIEGFAGGGTEEQTYLSSSLEFDSQRETFTASVDVEKWIISNRSGELLDSEGIDYASTEGSIYTGKEYYNTAEGKVFVEALINIYREDDALSDIPNVINNTAVVVYDGTSYSGIFNAVENRNSYEEDRGFDSNHYEIKRYYEKNGVKTIVIISDDEIRRIWGEPFYDALPHEIRRSDSYVEDDGEYEFEGKTYYFTLISYSESTLSDVLSDLNTYDPSIFIRDDETEAKHGQQFLQFESIKKQIKALIG